VKWKAFIIPPLICALIVSLTSCEVEFEPDVAQLEIVDQGETVRMGIPTNSGTETPQAYIGPAPSPNRHGIPGKSAMRRVCAVMMRKFVTNCASK